MKKRTHRVTSAVAREALKRRRGGKFITRMSLRIEHSDGEFFESTVGNGRGRFATEEVITRLLDLAQALQAKVDARKRRRGRRVVDGVPVDG